MKSDQLEKLIKSGAILSYILEETDRGEQLIITFPNGKILIIHTYSNEEYSWFRFEN